MMAAPSTCGPIACSPATSALKALLARASETLGSVRVGECLISVLCGPTSLVLERPLPVSGALVDDGRLYVDELAEALSGDRDGSLVVCEGEKLIGIITETDLVRRGIAEGTDLNKATVQSIMTAPIATIEITRTLQDAHDMMGDIGVRHLGVTDKGKLVGLVSVRDLLVYFKRVSEPKITQD
jgi:CBS domain-containing protein